VRQAKAQLVIRLLAQFLRPIGDLNLLDRAAFEPVEDNRDGRQSFARRVTRPARSTLTSGSSRLRPSGSISATFALSVPSSPRVCGPPLGFPLWPGMKPRP